MNRESSRDIFMYVWKTSATSSNAIEYVDRMFVYRDGKDQSRVDIIEITQVMNALSKKFKIAVKRRE